MVCIIRIPARLCAFLVDRQLPPQMRPIKPHQPLSIRRKVHVGLCKPLSFRCPPTPSNRRHLSELHTRALRHHQLPPVKNSLPLSISAPRRKKQNPGAGVVRLAEAAGSSPDRHHGAEESFAAKRNIGGFVARRPGSHRQDQHSVRCRPRRYAYG